MQLSNEAKINLLKLARKSIEEELFSGSSIKVNLDLEGLDESWGAFVTIHLDGQLRGCIGNIIGYYPLKESINQLSISAAFSDPRFSPISKQEYEGISLEITVLSKPKRVSLEEVEPFKHGVVLTNGLKQSTYLPQVWSQLPDKDTFFSSLCQKGRMDRKCYLLPETKIEIYEGLAFSEAEFDLL